MNTPRYVSATCWVRYAMHILDPRSLICATVDREEARARIEALGEPFKLEILDSIKTEPITMYHIGDQWWDLCAGPHVETTGEDTTPHHTQHFSVTFGITMRI